MKKIGLVLAVISGIGFSTASAAVQAVDSASAPQVLNIPVAHSDFDCVRVHASDQHVPLPGQFTFCARVNNTGVVQISISEMLGNNAVYQPNETPRYRLVAQIAGTGVISFNTEMTGNPMNFDFSRYRGQIAIFTLSGLGRWRTENGQVPTWAVDSSTVSVRIAP